MRAGPPPFRVESAIARGGFARLLLSLLLLVQLTAFGGVASHASEQGPPEIAALGRVLGFGVTICHHGEPGHPSDHGDCCSCPLCHLAHQSFALAPGASTVSPTDGVSRDQPAASFRSVEETPPFAGAAGPRGPPSIL